MKTGGPNVITAKIRLQELSCTQSESKRSQDFRQLLDLHVIEVITLHGYNSIHVRKEMWLLVQGDWAMNVRHTLQNNGRKTESSYSIPGNG